jgi:hypothetical protein
MMDELTTFERGLAAELGRMAGPGRRIDAASMARSVAYARRSTWRSSRLLSAAQLAIGGIVVAAFGGSLLTTHLAQRPAGVSAPAAVTASASPDAGSTAVPTPEATPEAPSEAETSVTTNVLDGVVLVTEEVEPGVLRIVNDGIRDLSRPIVCDEGPYDCTGFSSNLAVAPDGGIWVFGPELSYRLGDAASYPNGDGSPAWLDRPVQVAPDGTRWWLEARKVMRADEESAHGQQAPDRRHRFAQWFDLGPDGAVWATYAARARDGGDSVLVRRDGEHWTKVAEWPGASTSLPAGAELRFEISPTLPAGVHLDEGWGAATLVLLRETGESSLGWWALGPDGEIWDAPATEEFEGVGLWDMDAGGGIWAYAGNGLAHDDGTSTHLYTAEDGIPLTSGGMYDWGPGFLRAAPDGTLWVASNVTASGSRKEWGCAGVANFDGTRTTRYLTEHCILALRIGPDGSAWVQAGERTGEDAAVELYLIRR